MKNNLTLKLNAIMGILFISINYNYLVLLNEGSIALTLHYCMMLRVCCNFSMVTFMKIKFVKTLLKYLSKSRSIHDFIHKAYYSQFIHLQIDYTCRFNVQSLISSNFLSRTKINTSNSITQTSPGWQRLLWGFPLQPYFNHI